jgi:hypothetical protein
MKCQELGYTCNIDFHQSGKQHMTIRNSGNFLFFFLSHSIKVFNVAIFCTGLCSRRTNNWTGAFYKNSNLKSTN